MTVTPETGYVKRPDYRVDLLRRRNQVRVLLDDLLLADSAESVVVDEQDHGLVFYVPATDVRRELLVETDDHSRCPYKGEARYWRHVEGTEPIAWDYPRPYPEVGLLLDHFAFYQDRVRVQIGVADPAVSK